MIYTSHFRSGLLRLFPTKKRVGISRGLPRNWRGRWAEELAPTRAMLRLYDQQGDAAFDREYGAQLAGLDARAVAADYEGCVLLCWEHDPRNCHRSQTAAWLRSAGVEVKELAPEDVAALQPSLGL